MKTGLSKIAWVALLLLLAATVYYFVPFGKKIDYNTQVKPIFNKKCIACHGGVKKQGGFSVLFREEALAKTKSGAYAIVPGDPGSSELIKRIKHSDPEERMPYKHDPLSDEEIDILKKWIKQGAEWGTHWAYKPVEKQELPEANDPWIKNEVDRFILQKLQLENLKPSAEADKATLLRRLSLDLTGLPPDEKIAAAFLNDPSPDAYEKLVDSLLASPAYGERWTSLWLDIARYADTKGYESDQGRSIWLYRDWLINAFNADKPYDVFLTEQLAGDLMPNPDDAKYIATAFHRNSLTNDEGGTDNEEFRVAAVLDRVNTTWSGLMGTTFNCVQCHSHPYDPFKHEEYYKFMAFFNNTRDEDTEADYPLLRQYTGKDSLRFAQLMDWLNKNVTAAEAKEQYYFLKTWQPVINALRCDSFVNAANTGWLVEIRNYGTCRLKDVSMDNSNQFTVQFVSIHNNGFLEIYIDSLSNQPYKRIKTWSTTKGWDFATVAIDPVPGKHTLYLKYVHPGIPADHPNGILMQWFRFSKPFPGNGKPGYAAAKTLFDSLMQASKPATTPIMMENPSNMMRSTHVFERGNWTTPGQEVKPGVPHTLNAFQDGVERNRLGLAMWLTDKKNPLVSRTMINRFWEQLFGTGMVETLEDFGTQGAMPTHRELLDHLSWKFMNDYHWSMKKLLKEMVMSATYRQDSKVNEELLEKDPNNRLYARGSRVRLPAEQLRDQGLALSNLLSKKMFGKPVMPFQPEGIWKSPYNGDVWKMSEGDDMYRRALYTFWKRTAPYPSMITFDGASRTVCVTRRIRTNTPLQALTTLNDSAYFVMARGFAKRMLGEKGNEAERIGIGYRQMMYKSISPAKLEALMKLYNTAKQKYEADKKAASALLQDKNAEPIAADAAMVVVANAMLNLDEWVNKN